MVTVSNLYLSERIDELHNDNDRLRKIISKANDFIAYLAELDSLQTEGLQCEFDIIIAEFNSALGI